MASICLLCRSTVQIAMNRRKVSSSSLAGVKKVLLDFFREFDGVDIAAVIPDSSILCHVCVSGLNKLLKICEQIRAKEKQLCAQVDIVVGLCNQRYESIQRNRP